jgi:hypothetical protein
MSKTVFMKKLLIAFCALILISTVTVFAYNSDKGPVKHRDGITELPSPGDEELVKRGKDLVSRGKYNENDLKAIAAYLNSK